MTEDELKTAADNLQVRLPSDNLSAAFAALDDQLRLAAREVDLDSCLPGGASAELGMAASRGDGSLFYDEFKKRLRHKLCSEGGELSKLVHFGTHVTAGEVVSVLLPVVHLPSEAAGVLYPIAAIIARTGIESFCAQTR